MENIQILVVIPVIHDSKHKNKSLDDFTNY